MNIYDYLDYISITKEGDGYKLFIKYKVDNLYVDRTFECKNLGVALYKAKFCAELVKVKLNNDTKYNCS